MMRSRTPMRVFDPFDPIEDDGAVEVPKEYEHPEDDPRYAVVKAEFIAIDGGRSYMRQSEIVGLAWIGKRSDAVLRVYFSSAPSKDFEGDDARAIMRSFGLPEECP